MKKRNYLEKVILYLLNKNYFNIFNIINDKSYLKIKYKLKIGKKLDFDNPQTFNEKIQWLKLYDRNPRYTTMVDKYEVKNYVANIIGQEYIIPNIKIYDKFDEIDFLKLPNQFVIKCTHDSGGLVICKDKNNFDIKEAKKKINNSLKHNYFYGGREWPYKNVVPRILVEKYMIDSKKQELNDYKVFCFNGHPKMTLVCSERFSSKNMIKTFFDNNWHMLPIVESGHRTDENIEKPVNFSKMLKLSEKLAEGIPFVRIDWYDINGKLYFGEITFYPNSGYEKFSPEKWNKIIGDYLNLPKNK